MLITGASGSGTTTLGKALAEKLECAFLDADDFFWLPTNPPYTHKRPRDERLSLMLAKFGKHKAIVVSGSVMGWGTEIEDAFDLIVFLYLEPAIRLARLRERELQKLGYIDQAFLDWAASYDDGPLTQRSLTSQNTWLDARTVRVFRLEGDFTVAERLERVAAFVRTNNDSSLPA
jgi:uridine kinase